jgi:hypothetical protein
MPPVVDSGFNLEMRMMSTPLVFGRLHLSFELNVQSPFLLLPLHKVYVHARTHLDPIHSKTGERVHIKSPSSVLSLSTSSPT